MIERVLVRTALGQVHARCKTGAGRPLVMLHMTPRSGRMFDGTQRLLQRPVVAPDRIGYGYSDPPTRQVMTVNDYAVNLLEVLDALGIRGDFDVLGMHTGALEAIELAHLVPARVARVAVVALPVFDAATRAALLQKFAALRVLPVEGGEHLLEAWRARFQFREPPFDLHDIQRRLVEYLLAPWPGQAYAAVFRYDAAPKLQGLPVPLTVFAPRDDLHEVTLAAKPLVPAGTTWVDLPDFDIDLFATKAQHMQQFIDHYLPAA